MSNRKLRRITFRYKWDRLKVSFWFAPVVMSLGAILLAWLMYWVDTRIPDYFLVSSRLILAGSPAQLRTSLLSMATTTLTTAGVVFTLLTLPLSTVAAQYGSRLLRVFLGDRTTQLVLGMFTATFVYCLAAALSIPPVEVEAQSPQITASVGLLLMLGTFASLIILVQHISTMLQAPNIAAAAGAELRDVVLAELPEVSSAESQPGSDRLDSLVDADGYPVRIRQAGYIQYIDPVGVISVARENDLVIRLLCKPGCFVRVGEPVSLVWPANRLNEELEGQIRHAFLIGNARTPTQDIAYAINQLVEMAVRAMSPAINDPFTAMTCLDHIGNGLALFVRQGGKASHNYDEKGKLRLILDPVTFAELLDAAFDMLRHCSIENASVLMRMLEVIDVVGRDTDSPEARQELIRHIKLIREESETGALIEKDRQRIQQSGEALVIKLLARG